MHVKIQHLVIHSFFIPHSPTSKEKIRRSQLHRYIYEYRLPIGSYIGPGVLNCVASMRALASHMLELNSHEDHKICIIQTSGVGLHV